MAAPPNRVQKTPHFRCVGRAVSPQEAGFCTGQQLPSQCIRKLDSARRVYNYPGQYHPEGPFSLGTLASQRLLCQEKPYLSFPGEVIVHKCRYTCMCVHRHVCACECGGWWPTPAVVLMHGLPCFLRQGFSLADSLPRSLRQLVGCSHLHRSTD